MDEQILKVAGVLGILIVLIAGLALAVNSRLAIAPSSPADTDAYGYDLCADTDAAQKNLRGYGAFNDPTTSGRQRGEVWSTTRIWYAWFMDGDSRPATVEARTTNCGSIGLDFYPDRVHFVFSYSENGLTWVPFYQDRIPNAQWTGNLPGTGIGPLGSFVLTIDGYEYCAVDTTSGCPKGQVRSIKDGAALKVDVYISRVTFPTWPALKIASDQVELRSAVPKVWWGANAYKIGETAIVYFQIPTDKDDEGDPAYFLSVIDCNTNAALSGFDRKPLSGASGNFQIPVTSAMWSNDLATCQNRLRAEVLSQIIVGDQQDTAIQAPVSIGGTPPKVTEITLDKSEYYEGNTASISWKTSGNVTKAHVTAHINGLVVYDSDVDASKSSVSFSLPRAGVLQVEVTAYNRCQPSEVERRYATVGDTYPGLCEIYPELPECGGPYNWIGWLVLALSIIGIILAFALSLWLLGKIEVLPPWAPPLLAALIAVGLAILLISQGTFDVILGV